MRNTFSKVGAVKPPRSVFDLSYSKLLSCYHGQLIPVMADEAVPGDIFDISNEIVVRLMPLVSPVLHEINVYVHYFFVPYRLLWPDPDGWETFITGGPDGTDAPTLPTWNPTTYTKYSLWDYLGFPIGVDPDGAYPVVWPQYAYNLIYNEYYRDETQITEVALTNETILKRSWEKDYFTSSQPSQQRGTAPSLPVTGSAVFSGNIDAHTYFGTDFTNNLMAQTTGSSSALTRTGGGITAGDIQHARVLKTDLDNNTLSVATWDIADLRLAIQIQKYLERNSRAGARYTEFLRAHFGVSPRDERLNRPEYIGGSKSPIVISEVLQTSATGLTGGSTEQGNLAGHGITVDSTRVSRYRVWEYGIIMGIMSIMPRSQYSQGIDRQWLKETRYDYYSPEFAHLSEQAVIRAEIYANGVSADNQTIFGYQGRFDEMRIKKNLCVADMAYNQSFNYWTLGREFASAPSLNQSFIECDGTTASQCRIFAAGNAAPGYVVHFGNRIKAIRPLPIQSNPGLLDHV